ncbi:uncharacterized protein LOC144163939 [Haemaphysalis longicornis]
METISNSKSQAIHEERTAGALALDLKGAFDNVSHASLLENLKKTGCGRKTFGDTKDFLIKRTATIRIGEERSEPVYLGDRATLQWSVLSPLLFNLALFFPPEDHAPYADGITVWISRAGSGAWAQEVLQTAETTAHEYAQTCGLSCALQKSGLLMMQPGRPKEEAPPNVTMSIHGTQIRPTEQIRILGLLLRIDRQAMAAGTKIENTSEQITSTIKRVANRKRGLKGEDVLRLVQAFVVSRVTYSALFLWLTKADRKALNAT